MDGLVRLYLDVDGVLNAYSPMGWGKTETGFAKAEGTSYKIRWAPKLIEELSKLPVELVWTTTWRQDAIDNLAPLIGWGQHGRVLHPNLDPDEETTWPTIYWKMAAVEMDQLASPSPYIHIDDEFFGEDTQIEDALVIGPAPNLGIQPKHLERIREFLANLSRKTPDEAEVEPDPED